MNASQDLTCPFCGFKSHDEYQMLLHVEVSHSESGESPFAVADADGFNIQDKQEVTIQTDDQNLTSQHTTDMSYVECPRKCGEHVNAAELQFHIDFHIAEEMALEEVPADSDMELPMESDNDNGAANAISNTFNTSIPAALRRNDRALPQSVLSRDNVVSSRRITPSLKELFFGSPTTRTASPKLSGTTGSIGRQLGRSELGPYAHEKRMPRWLQRMLEEGAKVTNYNKIGPDGTLVRVESVANETPHLVEVFARLSQQDKKVVRAFYCSHQVRHVAKMRHEGGFCGYRNIQMLISYIRDARAPGSQHFRGRLPSIIKLQDLIEEAWDKGFNATGRVDTGGIRLTRKYIGTPEAQALMLSLDIPCDTVAFTTTTEAQAHLLLLQTVFDYFDDQSNDTQRIVLTDKPPIYFQHRGHSMTIVGVEVQSDGSANMVVFDPMFNPSGGVKKLIDNPNFQCKTPATLLRAHRRGEKYLSRYKEFELLKVRGPVYQRRDSAGNTKE